MLFGPIQILMTGLFYQFLTCGSWLLIGYVCPLGWRKMSHAELPRSLNFTTTTVGQSLWWIHISELPVGSGWIWILKPQLFIASCLALFCFPLCLQAPPRSTSSVNHLLQNFWDTMFYTCGNLNKIPTTSYVINRKGRIRTYYSFYTF